MLHAEYQRFLQSLEASKTSEGVLKISKLVLENLDEISRLGTSQGQRIKRIVSLASQNWSRLSPNITHSSDTQRDQVPAIDYLTSLKVGPFRGFARREAFDLSSKLVLIYGPNGTGKSSFCEALEFGLLGSVAEAESKRFRNQHDYLKNAHTNTFSPPQLSGVDELGNEFTVKGNEPLYRFCFVEKNRIDNFSRIAAQAPAKQTELISTLFGLDSFNEFVRNFSQEIDGKYLDLIGRKNQELLQKRQELKAFDQQEANGKAEIQAVEDRQSVLANRYCEGKTFNQMVAEIHDKNGVPGTISQLEEQLQKPVKNKSNVTTAKLTTITTAIQSQVHELAEVQKQLAKASNQVSFKTMFEALSELQSLSLDSCPACKTPLDRVKVNPFTNASHELMQLRHLADLQEKEKQLAQGVNQPLTNLSEILNICCSRFSQENTLTSFKIGPTGSVPVNWWTSLNQRLDDGFTPLQHLKAQVEQLEADDMAIDNDIQSRSSKQKRLNDLREFSRQIVVLQTQRQTAEQSIKTAENARANFAKENAVLIADAQAELATIETNKVIAKSYSDFVVLLNAYKEGLPSQLIADLGDRTVKLYNAFNRNDMPSEKLAEVRLPLAQNQRLELAFQNDPHKLFDALHILSEGHIRCIGLAILLAKNLKEKCPILIFDDPVNAIDEDHRESIRRTIFEDQHFVDTQVIMTCHGEEFFKDVCNLLPAQALSQSKTLSFLPRSDEAHIRVDFNCSPRNYIIAARSHFERNEIRDALTKSRQALETLTKGKIWRYVNKYGDGYLSIKLRSADAPIELRNLSDQLKKQIGKGDFADQCKERIFYPLEVLLGLDGSSREWRLRIPRHRDHPFRLNVTACSGRS
jgi:AAA15 family ATPase/GTPase/ABC-type arginine transport system ATPase subunit